MVREAIGSRSEGTVTVTVFSTYPNYALVLYQDGRQMREVSYQNEQAARLDLKRALHHADTFIAHGAFKDWPVNQPEPTPVAAAADPEPTPIETPEETPRAPKRKLFAHAKKSA